MSLVSLLENDRRYFVSNVDLTQQNYGVNGKNLDGVR
jgi:hypothetical protein